MKKFTEFVVKNKWVFIGVFAALAIAATVMLFFNPIIYDLTVFAPKNSNTDKSLEFMKEQFDDKGSAIVMVKNISLQRAEELAEELSEIDGVAAAVLDATNNYKSNCALYNIMLEDYDSTDGANKTIKTLIEYLSGEEAYFSGQSAMSYYTRLETVESIIKIGAVIAVAIMAMLLFTSQTYFELLIMLIVFAVSIVLNMGTNFVFGGISYVSNLVALVLQLALSIDYSVILLHRFMEEYEIDDAETAAATALAKGIPEILSSSLTTIAGLSALILMTLPIGAEMGLSLAKGIVASLLSVLFLMPALLVIMANPLVKSRHKRFVPDITKAAKVILKGRKVIMPAFLILTVLAGTGQFYNQYSYNINGAARIINSNNKIAEVFGVQNSLVVVVPKGDYNKEKELIDFVMGKEIINNVNGIASIKVTDNLYLSDKVSAGEIIRLVYEMGFDQSGLMATVFVNAIFETHRKQTGSTNIPLSDYKMTVVDFLEAVYNDYYDYLGENAAQLELLIAARKNFEGERYSRIIFNINSDVESPESLELIGELEDELKQFYPEFYLAGESVACYDMAVAFPKDNLKVSLFTTIFVLIILLFNFRNFLFPIILMTAIQGGIWINFAIPFVSGSPVSFIGYLLICGIQMGATIDYGIVLASRYNSEKLNYADRAEAMAVAENAVFPTIITSGSILTIAGFAMGILGAGVVGKMGLLLGGGALSSVLIVLLVLPSMLLVLDKISDKAGLAYIKEKIAQKRKKNNA